MLKTMKIAPWLEDLFKVINQLANFVDETLTTFTANSYQLTLDLK